MYRVCGEHLILPAYSFDVSHFLTYGEVAHSNALFEFLEANLRSTTLRVERDMVLWSRLLIRANGLYLNCSRHCAASTEGFSLKRRPAPVRDY